MTDLPEAIHIGPKNIDAALNTGPSGGQEYVRKDVADALIDAAERRGQIKAGGVLSTTDAEARWVKDQENACPCCGGSGHKDDTRASLDRIVQRAVKQERERCAEIADSENAFDVADAIRKGDDE